MPQPRRCKDCPPTGRTRPAPHPGPRCATHHREVVKARKLAAAEKRDLDTYGVTPQEREAVLAAQGGRCALCRRATGIVRRLATDHDHALAAERGEVRPSVRGYLCMPCNRLLGIFGDDPVKFEGIARYLRERPAQKILSDQ